MSNTLQSMSVLERNNVQVSGQGTRPMVFAHGFGCDQAMWRHVAPAFSDSHKVVLFDYVGAGRSHLASYDPNKYGTLDGYASDVVDVCQSLNLRDVIFVGHSVSAMIGVKAALRTPELFRCLILVAPSPSYINDGDYIGGFARKDIEDLLHFLDSNYLGWSATMAPLIMGRPDRPDYGEELNSSFCRMDPDIAKGFARVTFLTDCRADLPLVSIPSLLLQCSSDVVAPQSVGSYMQRHMRKSELVLMQATGHCPNLSAPEETTLVIRDYLERHGLHG